MNHSVVLIVGPTGVGKSDFALETARILKAGILNCDSVQTYQRLDIGTAKPTKEEQSLVPHFLFDIVPPGGYLTAGDYRREALEVLAKEIPKQPILAVGGSGFYIQALEKGMFDVPKANPQVDREVRSDLAKHGLPHLWEELEKGDPEYAEEINPNDSYRIVRALVVLREKGVKISDLRKQFKPKPFPYPLLKMGFHCDRETLRRRIELRTQKMLERGLLQEVTTLVNEGWEEWPPLHSVGYKECLQVLRGELPEEKLSTQISEKTMQLAKKQMTWFRRDKTITWFQIGEASENLIEKPLEWLKRRLDREHSS